MKRLRIPMHLAIVAVALVVTGSVVLGQNQPSVQPKLDSRTARILREMGAYLSSAGEFAFQAKIDYDAVEADGQKILFGARNRMWVRRPDRMLAEYEGDERRSRVLFNGRTITVYDLERNVYAVTEVPADLDNALDFVFERYGFSVPIADFIYKWFGTGSDHRPLWAVLRFSGSDREAWDGYDANETWDGTTDSNATECPVNESASSNQPGRLPRQPPGENSKFSRMYLYSRS